MIKNLKQKWQSFSEKKKQNLKGITFLSLTASLLFFAIVSLKPKERGIKPLEANYKISEEKSNIEDVWLLESQEEMSAIAKRLKAQNSKNKRLTKQLEDLELKLESFIQTDETEYLRKELEDLKRSQFSGEASSAKQNSQSQYNNNSHTGEDVFLRSGVTNQNDSDQEPGVPKTRSIAIVDFVSEKPKNSYSLVNYLPSGSYAQAVLISAVDASVGLSSQSNPRPVLFRILSEAKSALKEGEQLITNIKGCTVTGAASGDLSSERAYIRLLKMSCAQGDEIIETSIEGYAADGTDGKAGITGKVISREGNLLAKSFLAGIVSGVGSGISAKFQQGVTSFDGFTTTDDIETKDIIGQGLGEGVSQSSQNLSDYLIKRAEQYQPVISVASGKEVELVFMTGAYLDGRIIPVEDQESNQSSNINNFIKK